MISSTMTQCEVCGHSNPELSKFCGQCGRLLVRVATDAGAAESRLTPTVAIQANRPRPKPVSVSGPSFLGIDSATQDEDESASYLLEDEAPSHRGRNFLFFLLILVTAAAGTWFAYQRYYVLEPLSGRAPQPIAPTFAYDHTPASVLEETKLALNAEPALPNRALADNVAIENISRTMSQQAAHEKVGGVANTGTEKGTRLVTDGERYLYGRGGVANCKAAKQNFDEAAKQGNAAAMAHLGAMYGAGRCADFNRVTAYQWFAKAKNADPDNPWIESSMDMLWRNMSTKERAAILK